MSTELAKNLRELRNQKGLSYERLHDELLGLGVDISVSSLKNYEAEEWHHSKSLSNLGMNIKFLYAFAQYYEVSLDYLLGVTKIPSPVMDVRTVCDYTGLSVYSAEILHAFNAPKRGILTRLIDGIVSNIDEDTFYWIQQSALAEAISALGADFAEEKTDIMNRVGYLSRDRGGQYVLPASAVADYFLHKTIDTLTSQVAEVVEEMRNDMLSDIGEMQCDDARYFRFVKVDDEELTEGNDGND